MGPRLTSGTVSFAVLLVLVAILGPALAPPATAAQASLDIDATTTVDGQPTDAIAPGQPIGLVISYAGFGDQTNQVDITIRQTGTDPFLRTVTVTVEGDTGVETVRLDTELPDSGFDGNSTFDISAQATGVGPSDETVSDTIDVVKAPSTLYLGDLPSEVAAGESVTVEYYGWTTEPDLEAELVGIRSTSDVRIISTVETPTEQFFTRVVTFTPSDYVGSTETDQVLGVQFRSPQVQAAFWSEVQRLVVRANQPPEPAMVVDPAEPRANQDVVFDGRDSVDPEGAIDRYEWDLDDDGVFERQGAVVEASFPDAGDHTVRLRVTDEFGVSTTIEQQVTVREAAATTAATEPPVTDAPTPTDSPTATTSEGVYTRSPRPTEEPRVPPVDVGVGGAGGLLGAWALAKLTARRRPKPEPDRRTKNQGDEDRPPTAQIAYRPQDPDPGRPVLFDGSFSFDPDLDERLVSFTWTIGDRTSQGKRVVHVFGKTGEFDVTLTVSNSRGVTGTKTRTVTVEVSEGALELTDIHPDSPGADHENLHEESLAFTNTGNAPLDLEGWSIYDAAEQEGRVAEGDHTYVVPEGVTLAPEETLVLHTGDRPETTEFEDGIGDHHLYWGHHWPIWNNEADVVVVTDAEGHPVLATRYTRTEGRDYVHEDVSPDGLIDWFPDITVEVPTEVQGERVSIDTEVGRTAISNLVELGAGALYLRGTESFVRSWGIVTGFLFFALVTWFLSTSTGFLSATIDGVGPLVVLVGSLSVTMVGTIVYLLQRVRGSSRPSEQ